jgi:hypothetical protein
MNAYSRFQLAWKVPQPRQVGKTDGRKAPASIPGLHLNLGDPADHAHAA